MMVRTLVTGLCGMLLAVAPAFAEGAWVLWGQTVDPWNAVVVLRLGTFASREGCDQERRAREQAPEELRMAAYACLPETTEAHFLENSTP